MNLILTLLNFKIKITNYQNQLLTNQNGSIRSKLPLLPQFDDDMDEPVTKRTRVLRLKDYLLERKTINTSEATLINTHTNELFKIDFNDNQERQQFLDLLKMELDFQTNSFDDVFACQTSDHKSIRFNFLAIEPKPSFDKKFHSYLQKTLKLPNIRMLRHVKKNESRSVYYRFPDIVFQSLVQMKEFIDEFASLNASELDHFDYQIYDKGIEIPLSARVWDNLDLTAIDQLLTYPNGRESHLVTYQVSPKEQSLKELPSFVIQTLEKIQNHTVILVGKGRAENIWLIRCNLKPNQKVVVCARGMAHFSEWSAALSWQNSKCKLNYQCWGCGDMKEKKWNSIGNLFLGPDNTVTIKKPNGENEIVNLNSVEQQEEEVSIEKQSTDERNNETSGEILNPEIEKSLIDLGYLNQHTKFIRKGRTDNVFVYSLTCNKCIIDQSKHDEDESSFLVSLFKGRIKIKCRCSSCTNFNKWTKFGFIQTNKVNDQQEPHQNFNIDSNNDHPFDEKLLMRLSESNETKEDALHYINKYFAVSKNDKRYYCRDIEAIEKAYQPIRTSDDKCIFSIWKKWKLLRYVSEVVFSPLPILDPEILNTYVGFAVKPTKLNHDDLKHVVAPWVNHIMDVIANGDIVLGNYIINFLARIIQFPWDKGIVSLIIKSEHGAGKNVVFTPIEKILGDYFLTLRNVESSFSQFTGRFEKALLCVFDEAKCYNKAAIASIKSFIASPKCDIEKKFENSNYTDNYTNFVFLSNEDWILDIESTERRFIVIESNNKFVGRRDLETKIYMDAIRHLSPNILLQYLLERDLSNFDLVIDAPDTEASIDQKIKSLNDSVDRWLHFILSEAKNQPQNSWFSNQIDAKSVKNEYHHYLHNEDKVGGKPNSSLWKRLERFGIQHKHTTKNYQQGYFVAFPDFLTLQKKFAMVCFKIKNYKCVFPNS